MHKPLWRGVMLLLAGAISDVGSFSDDRFGVGGLAFADVEASDYEGPELRVLSDEEAKEITAALKKVYKKKDAAKIRPVLEKMDGVHHADWEKPMLRLLRADSGKLAAQVAGMWEGRVPDEKFLKKIWKASWGQKINDKRYAVKAKILLAWAPLKTQLDKNQHEDVERAWRWMVGNPKEGFSPALVDICLYVERTKDKRLTKWLAKELDEPMATNPNAPNNPPADWWERRWKMWKPTKPAVVSALKALTGQEFDTTKAARAWIEANEKTYGFKW